LLSKAGAATGGYVLVDDSTGVKLSYGGVNGTFVTLNGNTIVHQTGVANATSGKCVSFTNHVNCQAAGCIGIQANLLGGDAARPGVVNYGQSSGAVGINCTIAKQVINSAAGALSQGQVVVWAGNNTVSKAGLTSNLTTVAGIVIVGGAANATVTICKNGEVMALGD